MRKTSSALILSVLGLISIGIVVLASTSSVKGAGSFGDAQYFLKRQLLWLCASCVVAAVAIFFDYHWWQRFAVPVCVGTVILLVLVFVPHVGHTSHGSSRWIRLGSINFQPSEIGKFGVVVGMAAWMASVGRHSKTFVKGTMIPLLGLGVILVLLILEPDFGTVVLSSICAGLIMFVGGTRFGHLLVTGAVGASGLLVMMLRDPVRRARLMAYVAPAQHSATSYHAEQSKAAFVSGGLSGVGLGDGMQKELYLPEAHTDFIFATVGEELGLIFTLLVVALFFVVLVTGIMISFRAPDTFGRLLAFGFTMMIVIQAVINIGVVTGCLPTKGIALPFMSYGGSSLVMSMASAGVLINVARHCGEHERDIHTRPIKDRAHRF